MSESIFWVSNSPHMTSGYGRVTKNITYYLAGQHEYVSLENSSYDVNILGLQQQNAPVNAGNIRVFPKFQNDSWAKESMPYWGERLNPDVFITLMDVWTTSGLNKVAEEFNYCPHIPIESEGVPERMLSPLEKANILIPFSEFGKQQLLNAGFTEDEIVLIPHGVNTNIYRPITSPKKYNKESLNIEDKFVYLFVGTNIGKRKRIPRVMEAFKQVHDEYEDTILWLHTDPQNKRGKNLRMIAKAIGLEEGEDYFFTPNYRIGSPVSREAMNEIYNIADVFVSATEAEGFGLCHLESMASGTPSVMTDFSTAKELLGDNRGYRADIDTKWITAIGNKRALVNVDDFIRGMKKYYEEPNLLEEHSKNCVKFTQNYDWSEILPKWIDLIDEATKYDVEKI